MQYGLKIQFHTFPPMLSLPAGSFSASRSLSVSTEVSTLLSKSAITSVPLLVTSLFLLFLMSLKKIVIIGVSFLILKSLTLIFLRLPLD